MGSKPYTIYLPEFSTTSGGIRVMWGLFGWLLTKGMIVYINTVLEDSIAIYPEIARENPFKSNRVVRYILAKPGMMMTYGIPSPTTEEYNTNSIYKNDMFFVFSKVFDTFNSDEDHLMFLPILNLYLFKDYRKKRTKTCYLVGKGINKNKHPKDSVELNRDFAQDQKALAHLLNECTTLYCYDRLSAMMEVARLCGCEVQYYGDLKESELKKYEPGVNGLGYHGKEINFDYRAFYEHYEGMVDIFSKKLEKFIAITQS